MSDLGSDAGSTTLNLMTKVLEALLKLIGKIFDTWQGRAEREEHKYRAMAAKSEYQQKEAIKKMDGKTGYVNHKLLAKTGEPIIATEIRLTKEEAKIFNEVCKREGVLFSAVTNLQLKKDGEKGNIVIECRKSDLKKLRIATDRFNEEIRMQKIDKGISDILSKGEENLTPQDRVDLKELISQKEEIQRKHCERLNKQMQDTVLDNAFDESQLKPMDIGEALNRHTGRGIDKDQYSIIADASDPSKIIKCHGYAEKDPRTGKPYIKTEYEVYHGDKCVMKTHDGRFEGRPKGYWVNEKEKLENAAGFSGTYYKFFDEADYQQWAEYVNDQNREELHEMEKSPEIKDYGKCREDALAKLEENGAELKDGVVYDKESGKPLVELAKDPKITPEQKALAAESITVGKQIQNYDTVEALKNHLDVVNASVILAKPGTEEYTAAEEAVKSAKEQLSTAYEKDSALVEERKNINAVQCVQQTQSEQERQTGQEHTTKHENNEHPDDRREERVDEHDPDKMTMEEVKGVIEEEKGKDGAKGMDVKDREVSDPAKIKAPKSKPDRAD